MSCGISWNFYSNKMRRKVVSFTSIITESDIYTHKTPFHPTDKKWKSLENTPLTTKEIKRTR